MSPFRLWYYLRQGYGTYLVFVVAISNLMITMYYLAIKDIGFLKTIFPNFGIFASVVISVGIPLSIGLGYWHYKRSGAQRSQYDIETEVNPYYFKLPPGFNKEVIIPFYLHLLTVVEKLNQKQPLSEEDLKKGEELKRNLQLLIDGHMIGFRTNNNSTKNESSGKN
jgi:hypothetical protein